MNTQPRGYLLPLKRLMVVVLLGVLSAIAYPQWSQAAERNIIVFVTDDESPTLGCYGDNVAVTPAIDALAADGVVFDNAFATTASCSASRSVILSGLHNHTNGQYGHQHDFHKFASWYDVISLSLPRALARSEYRTARIGKYHVAPEEVYHFETVLKGNPRNAVQMADASADIIKSKSDKPFFLYFATSDPHRGGGRDEKSALELKPDLFGNIKNRGSHRGIKEVFFKPEDMQIPAFLPDTAETRSELAQYHQSCARIDQGLARLVEILKEAKLFDKTLILFTSDHGMAFSGGKTTVYEPGLRVPFVVRDPYSKGRGVRTQSIVNHTDITPSLLEFAGELDRAKQRPKRWVEPKEYWENKPYAMNENHGPRKGIEAYHGRSWIPILSDTDITIHDVHFASHTFHEIQMYYPMRAIRDHDWKLIWNIAHPLPYPFASDLWVASSWQAQYRQSLNAPYGKKTVKEYIYRPRFELYHIAKDPEETVNLADDPNQATVLLRYKEKLKSMQRKFADPWITKWDYE